MDAGGEAPPAAAPPADEDGFAEALAATIDHEGGWKLHRDSNGAAVYCGVNKLANPSWAGWALLPDAAPSRPRTIDSDELRALVGEVYREQYWDSRVCRFCQRWPRIRAQVFDLTVNHGTKGATLRLQEACLRNGGRIAADGRMGPATECAIETLVLRHREDAANNLIVDARSDFYQRLAAKPGRKRYLKGWLRRAESYRV